MKIKGKVFPGTFIAAGGVNLENQGYGYHRFLKLYPGFSLAGATPIMKTIVMLPRKGNMDLHPKSLMPKFKWPKRSGKGWIFADCVYIDFIQGLAANAINLSGPGADEYFKRGNVQRLTEFFFLSFMTVGASKTERLAETGEFSWLLARQNFKSDFGLFINESCPNTGHCAAALAEETVEKLQIIRSYLPDVILGVKFDASVPVETVKKIQDSGYCDAIDASQSVKWGNFPEDIDWTGLFGSTTSPLAHLGGGALTGWPILKVNVRYIKQLRQGGVTLPIIGGGGLLQVKDPLAYKEAGADGAAIGSQLFLRGWRTKETIAYSNYIFS